MRSDSLRWLRCPACAGDLTLSAQPEQGFVTTGTLRCSCGGEYAIRDGVTNFVYPLQLMPSDEEFQRKYDAGADQYDLGLRWLFESFYADENAIRSEMCDLLELKPNARVLEIGCGTGKDSVHIVQRLDGGGELWLLELSAGMIALARERLAGCQVPTEYVLANASYLPFAGGTFDAVFHFGGLNTFGEIRRALAEMTRVAKVGGKVVAGDEAVAPWLRRKLYGRILMNANQLYKHTPPLHLLPDNIQNVSLHWILGNAFYLIAYRVAAAAPALDLDLPIPGKRGGTLRSRYYGAESKP
jgi:ubiquinone/menaquinone biosynthesis C-methylase UbiE